jgi:hypothetical protein
VSIKDDGIAKTIFSPQRRKERKVFSARKQVFTFANFASLRLESDFLRIYHIHINLIANVARAQFILGTATTP